MSQPRSRAVARLADALQDCLDEAETLALDAVLSRCPSTALWKREPD